MIIRRWLWLAAALLGAAFVRRVMLWLCRVEGDPSRPFWTDWQGIQLEGLAALLVCEALPDC